MTSQARAKPRTTWGSRCIAPTGGFESWETARSHGPGRVGWSICRNPLTARVAVNRIWQAYFGRGLVETDNDFGTQGTPPSHPELLDWLACELMYRGWKTKEIHRLIVCSATYRQASRIRPDGQAIDPDNRLLWRQARLRLDAELIRDAALTSSGLQGASLGGPSVFPPQPDGVMNLGQMSASVAGRSRAQPFSPRALYVSLACHAEPSSLTDLRCSRRRADLRTRRFRSNTPLQSPDALERPGFRRDCPGAGRADHERAASPRK